MEVQKMPKTDKKKDIKRDHSSSDSETKCKRNNHSKSRNVYLPDDREDKKYKTSKTRKKKHKRKGSSSESSSSSSSDSETEKRRKRKEKKRKKKDENKGKVKEKNKEKKITEVTESLIDDNKGNMTGPMPLHVEKLNQRAMVPMTKEEYEKQQSKVRRVFDAETGRERLVKGDGEILEEAVSCERHKAINKLSTLGDGLAFQNSLGLNRYTDKAYK